MRDAIVGSRPGTIARNLQDDVQHADPSRLNRQRGLWNFLTRYFFLGQAIAVEQFLLGGAVHASPNDDAPLEPDNGSDAGEPKTGQLPSPDELRSTAEDGAGAPPSVLQAEQVRGEMPEAAARPDLPAPALADVDQARPSSLDSAVGGGAGIAGNGGAGFDSESVEEAPAGIGHAGDAVEIAIDSPVVDVGLDLSHGIALDLGMDGLLDLGLDVSSTLDAVATPILGLAGDTLASLHAANPALDALANVTDNGLNTLSNVLTGVSESFGGFLGGNERPDVGTEGVISILPNTLSHLLDPDPLFSDGKYTQLNISMHSEPAGELAGGPAQSVTSVVDTLLGHVDGGETHDLGHPAETGFGTDHNLLSELSKAGHELCG